MYYIRKYPNGYVIHDPVTGGERKLDEIECKKVEIEFECFQDEKVLLIQVPSIRSLSAARSEYKPYQEMTKT